MNEKTSKPPEGDFLIFPDLIFPVSDAFSSLANEFVKLMFAHSSFEREVAALQDAITKVDGFGERRENRKISTRQCPAEMVKLIEEYRGKDFAETARIKQLLTDAIDPCEDRNHLAHGNWWRFNTRTSTVLVRGGTRWDGADIPPEQREYSAAEIHGIAEKLAGIETELYEIRRAIE